jgi:hypothetical protein
MEMRLERMRRFLRLGFLFVILLIVSNLIILPLYYRSEKQDFKGLVAYLKGNLHDGDKIFCAELWYFPGILHYFGAFPENRYHIVPFWRISGEIEYRKSFVYRKRRFTIYHSKICCTQHIDNASRLWIIVGKLNAKKLKADTPSVFKGYFDGSFLNLNKFPTDASMYLFLWDPHSPDEKGIDMPIE